MQITIINIHKLLQVDYNSKKWVAGHAMDKLPLLDDAFLKIRKGRIHSFGLMSDFIKDELDTKVIDASGRIVMPTFCDSHTHLVYAGSRELEYVDKINGLSYEEIAQRGGGILNSAKRLNEASAEQLFDDAMARIDEIIRMGTGAVEIKSGYGLDVENELKMLRVIKRLKKASPISIKATFLGAHAVPEKYKGNRTAYVDMLISEMLPAVVEESLADYIDVFCDKGFFTVEDTDRILSAAASYGLLGKIHANELDYSGGIQVGVKHKALSVDHLEYVGKDEIQALLGSNTMPTVLPGAAFFLNMPFSPVKEMMAAGLPVALASDFNPGSSPSGNMKFIMSLACINYRMTPEQAIHATTMNGAYAMGLEKSHGSIALGKVGNVIITKPMENYEFLPYAYTSDLIEQVVLNGSIYNENK